MSEQVTSSSLNDRRIAAGDNFQDNMSRTEMIRNKWNESVRKYRAQQARAMQLQLAAEISRQPETA